MVEGPLVDLLEAGNLGDFWYAWWRLRIWAASGACAEVQRSEKYDVQKKKVV